MRKRELDPTIVAIFDQPPSHIDLAVSQVPRDNAAVIALLVLSVAAVLLRAISRLAMRNPFRLDDWLILVSLVTEESIVPASTDIDVTYQAFVMATEGLSLAGMS
ncbi:hypothetical protein AbraIFM66950_000972 [Aspergillus brasiliensis]|nr:hypothetical protein AbraIFM66950_000972 [Aspergillus brasiliensis]